MYHFKKPLIGLIISILTYLIIFFESEEEKFLKLPIDIRLRKLNYPIQRHHIITDDNFNITIFRLGKKGSYQFNQGKPVVFVPQFLNCIDSYVLNEEHLSPALVLANYGLDVWLMSTRGGDYSPNNEKGSNFSFHEYGFYDLSKTFEYVYLFNPQNISAIGHSQGGNTILVGLAEKRLKNTHKMIIYGGGIYGKHAQGLFPLLINSPLVEILSYFTDKINIGPSRFLFYLTKHFHYLSRLFFHYVIDTLESDMNISNLYHFAKRSPQPTTIQNILHYKQMFVSGVFKRYDYGPTINLQKYGQLEPPQYNLNQIEESIHLIYGTHDVLARQPDAQKFYQELKKTQAKNVTISEYASMGHISFILDKRASFLKEIISIIEDD
ncbi:hypothetical protein ABPG74_003391 [Tetrahymena malaccensis]